MIIKEFQKAVNQFGDRLAVKTLKRTFTYQQLDGNTNSLARAIADVEKKQDRKGPNQQVALLFDHGADMIQAVLGTLKAGKTYVPLDISYPVKRLVYMVEHSESFIILTDNESLWMADELTRTCSIKPVIINIETRGRDYSNDPVDIEAGEDSAAYILYTSGSTGHPKGVVQHHGNVLYYVRNWIQRFSITEEDRMTLFSAFTHDGAGQDMFAALFAGATLYPYYIKTNTSTDALRGLLEEEQMTIWHSVPSLFRFFCSTLQTDGQPEGTPVFENIRWVLLGGESIRPHDLEMFKAHFTKARFANVYGQTESSVSTICSLTTESTFDDVSLGEPLDKTGILLVTEDGDTVETIGVGEIVVACPHIAPGYWKDKETTEAVFTEDEDMGSLYWTGDLGQLTAGGIIKMMGRKDFQVKIRGYRVETGEIESALMRHEAVTEAVVVARENESGDYYLCAYYVSGSQMNSEELREFLSAEVPDYMLPRYFMFMEKMPLTASNKIDRVNLPEPDKGSDADTEFAAPRTETEEKLAAIWQEVLEIDRIGVTDNFIEVGGHSLLVITIISRIHQEFGVELELRDVFDHPTIRELAHLVDSSAASEFVAIKPAPEMPHYPATAEQVRMYILNQREDIGVTYNLPGIRKLERHIDIEKLESAFKALVQRHQIFRTSFRMEENQLVQVIHDDPGFSVETYDAEAEGLTGNEEVTALLQRLVRPFNMEEAPLLRVCLVKLAQEKYLLLVDMHHIISDGTSESILMDEFSKLYKDESLEDLKLQYKDYAVWQQEILYSEKISDMENYWISRFKELPKPLELPTNFPRPDVQSFEGHAIFHYLKDDIAQQLYQFVKERNTTLFNVMLGLYYILLYKYSQQEDIVIGSFISGRDHIDLERMVGLFVKTLPLRNQPAGDKTVDAFLEEVKENSLKAFEYQQYPLNRLVKKLDTKLSPDRNPLFDAAFILQNIGALGQSSAQEQKKDDFLVELHGFAVDSAMFDLFLQVFEVEEKIIVGFQFCTKLFKVETIELMKERFFILIQNLLQNSGTALKDLDITTTAEKEIQRESQEVEFDF